MLMTSIVAKFCVRGIGINEHLILCILFHSVQNYIGLFVVNGKL